MYQVSKFVLLLKQNKTRPEQLIGKIKCSEYLGMLFQYFDTPDTTKFDYATSRYRLENSVYINGSFKVKIPSFSK